MNETDVPQSAVEHWDRAWSDTAERTRWLRPEQDVAEAVGFLRQNGVRDTLDLGCGVGRHALLLAREGFAVSAIDGSRQGITYLEQEMARRGLAIDVAQGTLEDLPYGANRFDYVLAWNVIYHGTTEQTRAAIGTISRLLRPGGFFQGTMLSKRNVHYGKGREIAPDTFVDPTGTDKDHPHSYYHEADLRQLFAEYRFIDLKHVEHDSYAGAHHWHLLLQHKRDG